VEAKGRGEVIDDSMFTQILKRHSTLFRAVLVIEDMSVFSLYGHICLAARCDLHI